VNVIPKHGWGARLQAFSRSFIGLGVRASKGAPANCQRSCLLPRADPQHPDATGLELSILQLAVDSGFATIQILGAIVSPLRSSVKSGLGTSRFAAPVENGRSGMPGNIATKHVNSHAGRTLFRGVRDVRGRKGRVTCRSGPT
jgi:hypothetical protein